MQFLTFKRKQHYVKTVKKFFVCFIQVITAQSYFLVSFMLSKTEDDQKIPVHGVHAFVSEHYVWSVVQPSDLPPTLYSVFSQYHQHLTHPFLLYLLFENNCVKKPHIMLICVRVA